MNETPDLDATIEEFKTKTARVKAELAAITGTGPQPTAPSSPPSTPPDTSATSHCHATQRDSALNSLP